MVHKTLLMCGCLAACAAMGCAARGGTAASAAKHATYPAWVIRGSIYATGEGGPGFFGVGVVSGIRNMALARTTADNRARAEVAKLFEQFAVALVGEYIASAASTAGPQAAGSGEVVPFADAQAEQALKAITAATLNAVQVSEHWLHPGDGGVYALARLDLRACQEALGRVRDLPEPLREYTRRRAPLLHQQFERSQQRSNAGAHKVAS